MISLTLVRRIAARPSIVFDALVTPEGIGSWWGPDEGPVLIAETDVRVGGAFRVRFRMLDGTELTFTHARLRTESSLGSHTAGWNGALDKLGRHLLRLSEGSLS